MQNGVGESLTGKTMFSYERYGGLKETRSVMGETFSTLGIYSQLTLHHATDLRADMTLLNTEQSGKFEQASWKKEKGSWE